MYDTMTLQQLANRERNEVTAWINSWRRGEQEYQHAAIPLDPRGVPLWRPAFYAEFEMREKIHDPWRVSSEVVEYEYTGKRTYAVNSIETNAAVYYVLGILVAYTP